MDVSTLPRKFSVMGFRVERNEEYQGWNIYSEKDSDKLLTQIADYTWAHWDKEIEIALGT